MKRKLTALLLAASLAGVGTVVLISYVNSADDRAVAGEKTVGVLVVDSPIKKGAPAETLADAVTVKQVPAKVRAQGAVSSLALLRGYVTNAELMPGEQVLRSRFQRAGEETATQGADTSSLVAVSVALEPQRMLGGALRPHDLVAVFASTTDPAVTHLILHQVPVVSVERLPDDKSGQSSTTKLMVTLALSEPSAENFVWAVEHGTIWLSLEPKGADSSDTHIVTDQNAFQ